MEEELSEKLQTPLDCRKNDYMIYLEDDRKYCNMDKQCIYKDDKCEGKCRCLRIR